MNFQGFSKKKVIIVVAAIAVVGLVVYALMRKPAIQLETATVERGDVVELISVTGSIAASTKIELQPEVSGKVREVKVDEGQQVKRGDLLIRLDSGDIEAQLMAQSAALASARARLAEYEAGPTAEDIALAERSVATAQTRLESSMSARDDARTALDNARNSLDNSESKADTQIEIKIDTFLSHMEDASIDASDAVNRLTDPMFDSSNFPRFTSSNSQSQSDATQTRRLAKDSLAPIESARAAADANQTAENVKVQYAVMLPKLADVKTHLEAVTVLLNYAIGVDSTTLATYRLNASTALSNVSSVMQSLANDSTGLDLQLQLNNTETLAAQSGVSGATAALNAAENAVSTNRDLLAEAQASLTLKRAGVRPETVSAQRAAVSAEAARLAGLQNEFAKRSIYAPAEGEVTMVAVEVGENVQPGKVAVQMNAKGNLEVKANVSEIDIAKVKIGDSVAITLDAFSSGEKWTGSVVAIRPAETVVDNVIFYETTVKFESEDERLRPGMTANLDIETDRSEGALRIPARALKQNGGAYVEVPDGTAGGVRKVEVTIGLDTEDYVEILSGLKEGDEVVTLKTGG